MAKCCCSGEDILVVQGDILEAYFYPEDIDLDAVSDVFFTANEFDLCVSCPYLTEKEGWCLRLTSEVTSTLKPCISSYDLTLELTDGNVLSVKNGMFAVLKKRNKLCDEH